MLCCVAMMVAPINRCSFAHIYYTHIARFSFLFTHDNIFKIFLFQAWFIKPGFHIIVGIAGIARIAEKLVQRSWGSQRSQRSTGFHMIAVIAENKKKANHIEFICYLCPAIHPGILILVIFAKFIAQTVILQYSLREISSIGR